MLYCYIYQIKYILLNSYFYKDGDGTIDMVFYSWVKVGSRWSQKKDWSLHIVYNKQKPLCSKTVVNDCRSVHDLCSADDNYNFDFNLDGDVHISINLTLYIIFIKSIPKFYEINKNNPIFIK